MNCNNESTEQDLNVHQGASSGSNLYAYIDHARVWGVNIEPPESAKLAFKPWDQRHSMDQWIESGVDDQVCCGKTDEQDDCQRSFYVSCAYRKYPTLCRAR